MIIGRDAMSQGTVNLSGSNLTASGSTLTVGQGGNGSLSVAAGGQVTIKSALMVGQNAGSQGMLSITGSGSTLGSEGLFNYQETSTTIGGAGQGSVSIAAVRLGDSQRSLGHRAGCRLQRLLEPRRHPLDAGPIRLWLAAKTGAVGRRGRTGIDVDHQRRHR